MNQRIGHNHLISRSCNKCKQWVSMFIYDEFYNNEFYNNEMRDCLLSALRWMRDNNMIEDSDVNKFFIIITKQTRK